MGIPHYCKKCFRGLHGKFISNSFLLMSARNERCDNCEKINEPVVLQYFPFGEHIVTPDGKHLVSSSRHVGINPDYSFFKPCSIYPEHKQNSTTEQGS